MRHNAGSEAERVTHLVQVVAELANERFFGVLMAVDQPTSLAGPGWATPRFLNGGE